MNRMPRIITGRPLVGNGITISRIANGWTVELPLAYHRPDNEVSDGLQEGMRFVKQAIQEMHKDPLLARLQEPEKETEPEVDTEPVPKIGVQPNLYVFPTMHQVLEFLEEEFPD